jgi:hypothetical protein
MNTKEHTLRPTSWFSSAVFPALQRTAIATPLIYDAPPIVHEVLRSPGQPLDVQARSFMEVRFGYDFSGVQIHANEKAGQSADTVNALAYTVGQDIVFGAGKYQPSTNAGRKLIAHELTHVVQQRQAPKSGPSAATLRLDNDQSFAEHEARYNAERLGTGNSIGAKVQAPLQIARQTKSNSPEKSYWFQDKPPADKIQTEVGEREARGQPAIDPAVKYIQIPDIGTFEVHFAAMDNDFRGGKPTTELADAENKILDAIRYLLRDLINLPDQEIHWEGGATAKETKQNEREARQKAVERDIHERTVRARLKETFRELLHKPLNIFIATNLTIEEKLSQAPLVLKTDQVYMKPGEYKDPSKLQAAIRIPLVSLLGGEVGLEPGSGPGGMKVKTAQALTREQAKEALLHETMHVFLLNRSASAGHVWQSVGATMVKGPQTVKTVCENLMRMYLMAQEEVFVYTQVGEMYSGYIANVVLYQPFIESVNAFLASLSISADQTKTFKLTVNEQVNKKKIDWSVSYKHPKSITVSESHLEQLNKLVKQFGKPN